MLAYYFPPLAGGGVQRTLKHVKYLPMEGIEPIVLTSRPLWSPLRDATLGMEIPSGTRVLRAPEIPFQLAKWGLDGVLRRARLPTGPTAYLGWPDELVGWIPGATWCALRASRRYRPDVLYSTSSPVSAHVVALLVSRITGIPWVADFRDGWTQNPQRDEQPWPLASLSASLERAVVRNARYLVVVDESVELLGAGMDDPRVALIRNGVDPDDCPPPGAHRARDRFTISHVGALYGARDAAPVFSALRSLIERSVIDRDSLELRLVGPVPLEEDPNLQHIRVSRTGYVDHRAAVSEMASADALLFYAPSLNRGPSGKIFEYLVSGRPILCVAGQDNFASQLVEELGAGPCAHPQDQFAIEQAIHALYRGWQNRELGVSPSVRTETLRRFSRPALAGELARVLHDAAGERHMPRPAQ
jgi:glycosyltransferase involved in cell wall biosynthesis